MKNMISLKKNQRVPLANFHENCDISEFNENWCIMVFGHDEHEYEVSFLINILLSIHSPTHSHYIVPRHQNLPTHTPTRYTPNEPKHTHTHTHSSPYSPSLHLSSPSVRETHALAEAQQEKNSRLKEAFGISEYFVEGSSLDPNRKAKEELARAAAEGAAAAAAGNSGAAGEKKKYGWVNTPSPSPSPERTPAQTSSSTKREKKEKKKKKKRSRDR